jgi:Protein of unknown function (DUF669)
MLQTTLDAGFDVDNEEGTPPLSLLPKGKYKAEITDATVGPTKNGKGQAVSLTWTITEAEYENRLMFQRILIEHESEEAQKFGRMKFRDVCAACGLTGVVTDLDPLCYKPCIITVVVRKDKEGQYEDKNEVSKVAPVVSFNGDPNRVKKPKKEMLKEASITPKAFEAARKDMDDEIPF